MCNFNGADISNFQDKDSENSDSDEQVKKKKTELTH